MNITVRHLHNNNVPLFRQLLQLFEEVFDMDESSTVSDVYLQTLLSNPAFVACIAVQDNKVVGGVTAYELPMYYSQGSELFLYDMAVATAHQRKGVGRLLIDALKEYCKDHSIELMFVEAHEEDTHAVDFYRSTGGKAEKVVHFNYPLTQ